MTLSDQKVQIFETVPQWAAGLLYRLKSLSGGGVALYDRPMFVEWLNLPESTQNPAGLFIESCQYIVYFLESDTCLLRYYDGTTGISELIPSIGGCSPQPGAFNNPGRMMTDGHRFWVVDRGNRRVQAFSRDTYRLQSIIDSLDEPLDIALDRQGFLLILDRATLRIHKFDLFGNYVTVFGQYALVEPVGLAVGKAGMVYVVDSHYNGLLRFTESGEYIDRVGDSTNIDDEARPSVIGIDKNYSIFVAYENAESVSLHQFDAEGIHVGEVELPEGIHSINGIAFGGADDICLSTNRGIAWFNAQKSFVNQAGIYYSPVLDNGQVEGQWDYLELTADIPERTSLEISYYSSDDNNFRKTLDEIYNRPGEPLSKKAEAIEAELGAQWIGPETVKRSLLFRNKTGRYLLLRLALTAFDEDKKPQITSMKVYYPRVSFLKYLPAFYQDDPVCRDFLERFLAIFEVIHTSLESEITMLHRFFDPDKTRRDFLPWLGSWLNFSLEEGGGGDLQRRFLIRAPVLFKQKGTPEGIRAFVEILTGKSPIIIEPARSVRPLILSKDNPRYLGVNSVLTAAPIRGFRLGQAALLGRTAIRSVMQLPEDPFLYYAYRFLVLLPLTPAEYERYRTAIQRIINDHKPAHTCYTQKLLRRDGLGPGFYAGINTSLSNFPPFQVDVSALLGSAVAMRNRSAQCSGERKDLNKG